VKFCNLEVNQDVSIVDPDSARENSWYRTNQTETICYIFLIHNLRLYIARNKEYKSVNEVLNKYELIHINSFLQINFCLTITSKKTKHCNLILERNLIDFIFYLFSYKYLFKQMEIIKPQQAFRFKRSTTPTWSIFT